MDPPRKTFDSTFGYFSIRLCNRNVLVFNVKLINSNLFEN